MRQAAEELKTILNNEDFREVPVVVLTNKQDVDGACGAVDVTDRLGLNKLRLRKWHVTATNALSTDPDENNLRRALDWLHQIIESKM